MKREFEFVEEMGQLLEDLGPGRMAGRVMGYLLICEPEEQTAAQLAEALNASKGSISTVTRLMSSARMIRKIRVSGHRSAYYKIQAEAWPEMIRSKAQQMVQVQTIARRGLEIMRDASPERRARLEIMVEFYEFMGVELPALFERWQKHHEGLKR